MVYIKNKGKKRRARSFFGLGHKGFKSNEGSEHATTSTSNSIICTRAKTSAQQQKPVEDNDNEYLIIKMKHMEDLTNEYIKKHHKKSPGCNGRAGFFKTEQRLISCSFKMSCDICQFSTDTRKMYDTVSQPGKRGLKDSTLNRSLASALLNLASGLGSSLKSAYV